MRTTLRRLPVWIALALAGALYGAAGTVAHAFTVGPVPVGLAIAIVGVAALLAAARLLARDRWSAFAAGAGAVIAALVLSGESPGGSVIVPAAPDGGVDLGLVWTLALPIVVAVVVAWPDVSTPRRRPGPALPGA